MPVGVLLLVAVIAVLGGCWAWSYQRRALDLLYGVAGPASPLLVDDPTAPDPAPDAASEPASDPDGPPVGTGLATSADGAGHLERVATEQLDRKPVSVLGWAQFSVVSVVVMEGTAIVACRSRDGETGRRRRGARSRSRAAWPLLLTTDQTLVLLMGEDAQAQRARALLERWRRAAAILWLRPTAVAGGIEFYDGYGSALRAMLLAD